MTNNPFNPPRSAIERYKAAFRDEWNMSGRMPVVAVIGTLDFHELMGELQTLFEGMMQVRSDLPPTRVEWEGVRLFEARSFERGFWFAALPEDGGG